MTGWIRAAVESARPGRAIESIERPVEGNRKETAIVTVDGGERLVVQRTEDPSALRTETRLAREIAARTTVPVPTVLECGRVDGADGRDHGGAYRVVEAADGTNLHERFGALSPAVRRRIAERFGRALAEIHGAFAFERFGPVVADAGESGDGGGLRADGPDSWTRWLDAYIRECVDALPEPFADLEAAIEATIEARPTADPTPRLFPWDFRPGNAMIDRGELTAFLDWGDPLAAGAGLSLAKAEHLLVDWYIDDGTALRTAFRDGYTEVRPLPEVGRTERVAAVVDSAVDSDGAVTRPGYPERTGAAAVEFHRRRLRALL
ncbi:APH family phosphotransferase [Natronomonas moolapensis 8.8.11]|uniref:APH family phosphotransferase n=1 Tax=Natronomonas moolapensis (strain DSM 18674 / CECT 7526 / JCM 14361 / 8.8.11) TaxID=268739 RepID=M1Y3N9_NATM8|nr:phosphotransferase [Natronomonas moolapensis]CCQ37141.1 APH family phosphotransferase [Natronomonas moolapensis 8.8.11]